MERSWWTLFTFRFYQSKINQIQAQKFYEMPIFFNKTEYWNTKVQTYIYSDFFLRAFLNLKIINTWTPIDATKYNTSEREKKIPF